MNVTPLQKQTISPGKTVTSNPASGSKNYGQITTTGHLRDVYPSYEGDSAFTGNYNASPTNPVYQVVVIRGSDGTTAADVYVSVKHEAYTELQLVDAIVS